METITPGGRRTTPVPRAQSERAQAHIRWPKPDGTSLMFTGLWALGLVIALVAPAMVVPPGDKTADAGPVVMALSLTVFGALIMLLAAFALWRKYREPLLSVLGAVPAIAVVAGGIMLAATKTFAT
jgi:hypothetical protein